MYFNAICRNVRYQRNIVQEFQVITCKKSMQKTPEYNLFCFTKDGGIPLFSRSNDQSDQVRN